MTGQLDKSGSTTWFRLALFATAFLTGAVVMALEILGSRLLAPVFGTSLFVWGALIGVILAAMSSGYAMAGWMADRHHPARILAGLLLGSGGWTLLLAWAGQPVLFTVSAWLQDPRWGPCLAASVLLAPPAFGLSGALPALLRLSIADLGSLGRHTGSMIAVSTIGSLAGTWGTAFYLLTWLGSMSLLAILGLGQVVLGLLWWRRTTSVGPLMIVSMIGALGLMACLAFRPLPALPTPLYQEDSPYQQIRILEDDLLRYLILDRTIQAVMWRADPVELFLPYTQLMTAGLAFHPEPRRGLMLGLGGGSLAKWLAARWAELDLTVVEVDPSVVRTAGRYFGYSPPAQHHVHVQDARAFLRRIDTRYDVIWLDVFARHLIPFHLTTREFFAEVRSHLTVDGVLVLNLPSSADDTDRVRVQAVLATLRTSFPRVESFGVQGPWRTKRAGTENLVFFAGSPATAVDQPDFATRMTSLVARHRLPFDVPGLLASPRNLDASPEVVLTDDYAPFDLLVGQGETAP